MKKLALALGLALAVLAAAGPARAQSSIVSQIAGDNAATDKLHFSLRFGMSCGVLRGIGYGDRLGGFGFGLSATIKLSGRLSLVPEIAPASRKGITEIPFVTTGDPSLDPYFAAPKRSALVLDYVDVPVQVRYRLGRFHAGAGAFVGFLSAASERFRAETGTGEELLHTRDVAGGYRGVDYGLVLEGSWTITRPRRGAGLLFHVRYQAGLADILADPAAGSPVRTSVIQVFLSFPFVR